MRISPLPLISRLGLALCLLALLGTNSLAQDADRFEKDWEQTKKLGRDGRWSTQVNLIRKILAEHEGRPYVRAKRTEIEAEIRNAQFGVAHPLNDARSLIPGEVKAFNRYSGKLKVRLNDPKEKKSFKNLVCPIVFDGPHSISLRGDAFRPPLRIVVCFDNKKGAYDVTFNGKQEVIASTLKGRRWSKLSTKKAALQTGRPYNVQVKVSAGVIEAKVGTRSVLRIKKARDHFGQLTLGTADAEFTEVEGQASKAWLQGLVDTERHRLFTAFQKSYKPKEELPAWLYETADLSKAAKIDPKSLPGGTKDGEEDAVKEARKEILKALRQRNRRKGLENALAIARNQKLRPIVSLWLESTTLSMAGDLEGALVKNAELLKKEPAFDRGRLERAVLYRRMKDLDRCRAVLDDLIARYPDDPRVIRDKVNFLLISGGNTEGRKLLQSAIARGVEDKELIDLERLLVKAEKGPAWSKPFEVKTRHYIVRSNMNREICREAAQVLEAGYLAYKAYLPARASDSTERFPVYIFNSEKGYLAYSSGITGSLPVRSAGLYSPVLQQLLIWNLPNHEQIMQTVRHEGLHQYVDRVMPPPARWFNEGHAEYFEAARGKSSWKLGLVRKDHVRTLTKMSRRPEALRGFLDQGDYQFLRNAGLNYAMSWLLVHFLHHGGIENKQILRKLFDGYMAGKPHDKVWDIAFEKIDFKEFERRLWEHYRSLDG